MFLLLSAALADCVILVGGLVYIDGEPVEQNLILQDGRVVADSGGEACDSIEVQGKHITPGLIDPATSLGMTEVGMEHGGNGHGDGPAYRVVDGYNPRSTLIPVARMGGVTSAITLPGGRGIGAFVDLTGDTQSEALVDADVTMVIGGIGGNTAKALYQLRLLLDEARRYKGTWDSTHFTHPEADLKALQPVLRRELPLLVSVERASDIEALLRFVDEQKVDVVLRGASESWMLAEELASRDIPVILNSVVYGPGSFDQIHARADAASILDAAGVTVMFSSFSAHNPRELTQFAGNAVRDGLPHAAGIRAITANPAQAFGLTGYGSLQPGSVANVVVWSGDPLELTSSVEQVWIRGEAQPLRSRQTELRDRYMELPGSPVEPLSLD